MSSVGRDPRTKAQLLDENGELRRQLDEVEQTLEAIRSGDVDALVVADSHGDRIYTLAGAEHVYRVVVETMNEAALTVDLDGTILFCNQRFCDLMKTPMQETLGRSLAGFAARPQQSPLKRLMADAQIGPVQRRITLQAADETVVPVQLSASLLHANGSTSLCLVASDLTELEESANSIRVLREHQEALQEANEQLLAYTEELKVRAEELHAQTEQLKVANEELRVSEQALRESETRRTIAMSAGELGAWETDLVTGHNIWDERFAILLGIAPGQRSEFSDAWMEFIHPEDRARVREQFQAAVDGLAPYDTTYRVRRADGTERWWAAKGQAIRDAGGAAVRMIGIVQDITDRKRLELELQESQALARQQAAWLETVLDAAPAIIWIAHDHEARNITGNRAAREFSRIPDNAVNLSKTGTQTEKLAHFRIFAEGVELEPQDMPMQVAARSGVEFPDHTLELRFDDGARRWLMGNIVPLLDDRGWSVGAVGAFLDITARKEAEEALRESEERFRTMADGLPMMIWVTDAQGGIQFINRSYCDFFGVTLEQVRGPNWQPLVHPEDAPAYVGEFLASSRDRQPFLAEVRVRRADGQWRWIASYGVPRLSATGDFLGMVGGSPDITDRKRADESLRELTRTLETRVAERTRELEHRARQLQKLALELSQAEEQERRRLAEILHDDLQQQLAAVKFHLGIMGSRTKNDAALQKAIAQLDKMLKDAIETSRNLSHELSPAVMYHGDLGEVIEWLANQIRVKHGLIVHVDARGEIDTQIEGLKAFLYKAVQELLFNTVKHARVTEAMVRVRRRGRYVCLCVSDHGRGFDPQDLRKTAGFGLMSIRERIGLLGGRMRIHSVQGMGSRFIVTVPDGAEDRQAVDRRPEAGAEPTASSLQPPASLRPLRVLIADDHEIVRQGLASLLGEAEGVELVGEAGNGREAVDLAYQLRPDVVILDVAMPLINGDEAARQIRRHLPGTRIVALSMHDEAGVVEKMHRAGAESYVLKTAPSEELLAAVRGSK